MNKFKIGDIVRLVDNDGMNAAKGSRARVVEEGYTNVHIGSGKNLIKVEWIRPLAVKYSDTMVEEGQMDGSYYEDAFVLDEPQDAPVQNDLLPILTDRQRALLADQEEELRRFFVIAKKYNLTVTNQYGIDITGDYYE